MDDLETDWLECQNPALLLMLSEKNTSHPKETPEELVRRYNSAVNARNVPVLTSLANNWSMPSSVISEMIRFHPKVKAHAARNPKASREDVLYALTDPNSEVHSQAALNPKVTTDGLRELWIRFKKDKDTLDSPRAAKFQPWNTSSSYRLISSFLANPKTPIDIRETIINEWLNPIDPSSLSYAWVTPELTKAVLDSKKGLFRLNYARNAGIDNELLTKFSKSALGDVRVAVAKNPSSSHTLIESMIENASHAVQQAILNRENSYPDLNEKMFHHHFPQVKDNLPMTAYQISLVSIYAFSKNIPKSIVKSIVQIGDPTITLQLIKAGRLNSELLQDVISATYPPQSSELHSIFNYIMATSKLTTAQILTSIENSPEQNRDSFATFLFNGAYEERLDDLIEFYGLQDIPKRYLANVLGYSPKVWL